MQGVLARYFSVHSEIQESSDVKTWSRGVGQI